MCSWAGDCNTQQKMIGDSQHALSENLVICLNVIEEQIRPAYEVVELIQYLTCTESPISSILLGCHVLHQLVELRKSQSRCCSTKVLATSARPFSHDWELMSPRLDHSFWTPLIPTLQALWNWVVRPRSSSRSHRGRNILGDQWFVLWFAMLPYCQPPSIGANSTPDTVGTCKCLSDRFGGERI